MAALLIPDPVRTQAQHLLSTIGNTPLLRLDKIGKIGRDAPGVAIYAKAEYFNPGGSVKDRAGLNMILDGERTGRLRPEHIILDATSGNTGIAYAMVGAAEGAVSEPAKGSDGAKRKCREIYEADPDLYFYPDQYNNPANWKAHFETTGREIIEQTSGLLTHFVAAMGTSGTFTGVSRRLHRDLPHVKCYSGQPSSSFHGLEGLKHMPTAIVPGSYDPTLADGNIWLETEEAYAMVRRLAREEGLLVGISSGCNVGQ